MEHRIPRDMETSNFPASGKALYVPSAGKHLLKWGTGALTGNDAILYFRTDGTTSTTILYVNVNGTWTALTIN